MIFEKSIKIQLLSQTVIITIFVFMLSTFVTPAINANSDEINQNVQDIHNIKLNIAEIDIEDIDEKLDAINIKLNKIVLGMCGEFGGKYCD